MSIRLAIALAFLALAITGIATIANASPYASACTGTTIQCSHTPIVGDAVHEHDKWHHKRKKH